MLRSNSKHAQVVKGKKKKGRVVQQRARHVSHLRLRGGVKDFVTSMLPPVTARCCRIWPSCRTVTD